MDGRIFADVRCQPTTCDSIDCIDFSGAGQNAELQLVNFALSLHMLRRAALIPTLIAYLSVLAVGLAFVACQFHPYDRDYGWPCTWLTRHHGWHLFEFAISAMTAVIMIASTYHSTYAASQLFFSPCRARSHIRLSFFFVCVTVIAILLSFCNFTDAPPEWLEPYTEYQFTTFQMLIVIPLLFGFGCVVCLAWSLMERAILRLLSRDAASE